MQDYVGRLAGWLCGETRQELEGKGGEGEEGEAGESEGGRIRLSVWFGIIHSQRYMVLPSSLRELHENNE